MPGENTVVATGKLSGEISWGMCSRSATGVASGTHGAKGALAGVPVDEQRNVVKVQRRQASITTPRHAVEYLPDPQCFQYSAYQLLDFPERHVHQGANLTYTLSFFVMRQRHLQCSLGIL
jgi:hypothetical protein